MTNRTTSLVIALATLIFVFSLSLLGVFQLPAMATGGFAVRKKQSA